MKSKNNISNIKICRDKSNDYISLVKTYNLVMYFIE